MNSAKQIRLILLLTLSTTLLLLGAAPARVSDTGKVVFLKENEVETAKADGSDVKVLTSDHVPKKQPVWSPGGSKIAYLTPGTKASNPKTHANIVIINAAGAPRTVVPVLSTEADGTFVEGLRFVEAFGWYGDNSIFAMGSLNPRLAEYRILDASTAKVIQSYFGYDFATCADQARVAYVAESQSTASQGIHIELQGTPVYSPSRDDALRSLRWSTDCTRLAFLQIEKADTRLVILHIIDRLAQIEAMLPLQKELTNPKIVPAADSFLLNAGGSNLSYNSTSKSLQPALDLAETVRKQELGRDLVMRRLGGGTPDWWEPRPE